MGTSFHGVYLCVMIVISSSFTGLWDRRILRLFIWYEKLHRNGSCICVAWDVAVPQEWQWGVHLLGLADACWFFQPLLIQFTVSAAWPVPIPGTGVPGAGSLAGVGHMLAVVTFPGVFTQLHCCCRPADPFVSAVDLSTFKRLCYPGSILRLISAAVGIKMN